MGVGKLSNVDVGDIDNVSSVSDIAKISGIELSVFGSPTILRLSIANDGDSWDPPVKMYSGTGVIDWGDGTPTESVGTITLSPHTYATAGTYDVTVTPSDGDQTRLVERSNFISPDTQVTEVVAFGDCGQVGFRRWEALVTIPLDGHLDLVNLSVPFWGALLFAECSSFIGPTDLVGYAANLGPAVNMGASFRQASMFNRGGLGQLDTSSVTSFSSCLDGTNYNTAGPEDWDTSSGVNFFRMFFGTPWNRDLSGYNMSSATNISQMFSNANAFNQDISGWNVSGVTDMSFMFNQATAFDQDLGAWTLKDSCIMNEIFRNSGMSNANVALCLEGWDKVGQGTSVDATDMFGSTARTLSESTYPNAKTAYDNLISTYSWDFTGSFNWVA